MCSGNVNSSENSVDRGSFLELVTFLQQA